MKKIIITQSNYIPWKGYFDSINSCDECILYDDMQYTKRDWRNRNMIKTPSGVQWLTIPVEVKGKFYQKINETIVSERNWGVKHWKAILHNYSQARYFNKYKTFFEPIYLNDSVVLLSQINYDFITTVCEILEIKTKISRSSDFKLVDGKTERLVDLCKQREATDYFSGPAAKEYMDEMLFARAGINVRYFDYGGYPAYTQLYGAFVHHVSILDLLFNEGENAKKFMKSFK